MNVLNGGLPFPSLPRPPASEIAAAPSALQDYISALERRAGDLSDITSLLREMHVFPDMQRRIDERVKLRIAEAEQLDQGTMPEPDY